MDHPAGGYLVGMLKSPQHFSVFLFLPNLLILIILVQFDKGMVLGCCKLAIVESRPKGGNDKFYLFCTQSSNSSSIWEGKSSEKSFWGNPLGEVLSEKSFGRSPFGEVLSEKSFWRRPFREVLSEKSFWRSPFTANGFYWMSKI